VPLGKDARLKQRNELIKVCLQYKYTDRLWCMLTEVNKVTIFCTVDTISFVL
jgi:hypothetical protein